MNLFDEYKDIIQKLNVRLDSIEKLLNLLLISSLIEDIESIISLNDFILNIELKTLISKFGLKFQGIKRINEIKLLAFEIPDNRKISIKDLKHIYLKSKCIYTYIEPVFIYKSINGMHKKRIIQEKISFVVEGKEIHIVNGGRYK